MRAQGRWRLIWVVAVLALAATYKALNGHFVLIVWDTSTVQRPLLAEAAEALAAKMTGGDSPRASAAPAGKSMVAPGQALVQQARPPAAAVVVREVAPAVTPAPAPPPPPPTPPPAVTKCPRPPPLGSLTELPKTTTNPRKRTVGDAVLGIKWAWCHDGKNKNGMFTMNADGKTGGDFPNWNLKAWKVVDDYEVSIHDGKGGNDHKLVFNCDFTGFAVRSSSQKGYAMIENIDSPQTAEAPLTADSPRDCRRRKAPAEKYTPRRFPVWVWWDFQHGAATPFRLNYRTWQRHVPQDKFELHLVNLTNIRKFLPGIPEPFFRLYHAAKSDFLRAALLAVHGGVYLDGDIMLSHDLDVIIKDLLEGKVEALPYEGPGDSCGRRAYTTNFMAGKKGNPLSSKWIEVTMEKMMNVCDLDESKNDREPVKVCCYNKDWCPRHECHVAWGDISHPPPVPEGMNFGCIPYKQGLATTETGKELFYQLSEKAESGKKSSTHCYREGASDVVCGGRHLPGYFDRHGHHLYNMLNGYALAGKSEEEVLKEKTLVGELYRQALGISTQ